MKHSALLQLITTSIKMFFRDGRAVFFSLFMPILFMVIFGLADFGAFANTKIGIIDNANTDQSQQIIDTLTEIEIMDVETGDPEELKSKLEDSDLDLILELPTELVKTKMVEMDIEGWPAYLPKPQQPEFEPTELILYTNEARAQQGQSATAILKEVFNNLNYQIAQTPEIFNFKNVSITQKEYSYLDFIVPGIVALSIMQMSVMQIIFIIVGYREKGVLKRLQTTPIKSFDFTASQVITRLIVSFLQVVVLVSIAVLFFNVSIVGSLWLIALLTIIGSIIFIAMGMAFSAIAKTQNTAGPLANIIMMPMMFLGDVFFPVATMPEWIQNIVQYLPLNNLAEAMRQVMINGSTVSEISFNMYMLLLWMVLMVMVASFTFRWKTID